MKRIGIVGSGLVDWGGGIDLLRLLLGAVKALPGANRDFEVLLFLPALAPRANAVARTWQALRGAAGRPLAKRLKQGYWELRRPDQPRLERKALLVSLRQAGGRLPAIAYRSPAELRALARKHRVDVLAPSMIDLGRDSAVPWVGYLPDVQHKHLPQLFSADDLAYRDASFAAILRHADAIMATSEAVKRDLLGFFAVAGPVVGLPFATAEPTGETYPARSAAAKHGAPGRYFIVCNQFWKHKSHGTAFEALARLHATPGFEDVALVCTGITEDYRDAAYFPALMLRAQELGIRANVHVLGRIAKHEQLALLSGAVALVQPTLFEGTQGGLAVYDAVSLGQRAIVSDIPVNVEARDPLVTFFKVGDAQDLARAMRDALTDPPPRPDLEWRQRLARERIVALGQAFLQVCDAAIAGRQRPPGRSEPVEDSLEPR